MNNLLKFVGGVLALPFEITVATANLVLLPIKILRNWLKGYGHYNKAYWKFTKHTLKKTWYAIKRGEKPTLHRYMAYTDDQQYLMLLNEPTNPIIFNGFRN